MAAAEQVPQLRPWSAPLIDGHLAAARRGARGAGEAELSAQRAWKEAEEAGRAAGLAAAQKEIAARLKALDAEAEALRAALQALTRPLAHVDDEVHAQIAHLATAIARGLLRRELKTDPAQIIGIVRDTVGLLPANARGMRVMLHPEDAALVRGRLATPQAGEAWSIVEDPVLSRGDCRVVTEHAQIDARLETRLSAAVATLLGDERRLPRSEDP
ncbi:MAG: FliH/SctL family protein [Steroidobacteraceae bacterium]